MVTIQFFGGPKDGETMMVSELRSVVHIGAAWTEPDCRVDRLTEHHMRVYDYQLRIAEGNAVVLADQNYAFDVVGSGRDVR